MRPVPAEIESKLRSKGLWPETWTARAGIYVLLLDVVAFILQLLVSRLSSKIATSLGGWITFLSVLVIVLFTIVGFRWLRSQILWRLRNRLIVTYVFIGVIPVLLLVMISSLTLYLLAGQFANFVVMSEIATHLRSMQAANNAIASELAEQVRTEGSPSAESLAGMRAHDPDWVRREVCAWGGNSKAATCSGPPGMMPFGAPSFLKGDFREIIQDQGVLYLRAATVVNSKSQALRVVSSEPLDKFFVEEVAANLGEITLYVQAAGATSQQRASDAIFAQQDQNKQGIVISRGDQSGANMSVDNRPLVPTFVAGSVPPESGFFDRQITFGTPVPVVDWATGEHEGSRAVVRVETRPSVLYARLFAALGDFAKAVEDILLFIAIVFGLIEVLALIVGTKLTRSITSAVAQLYEATKHINRGDFSHRIVVKSNDQLATLANSFNSMTSSIERLIQEQKEKQRLENELAIAQEVQEQLFPKRISQLESLEVHGFCRPARTVSGDYYDFLSLNSDKMVLAVGDVSGKGISAALMMATIHSAVRAYSLEGVPLLAAVGATGSGGTSASNVQGAEVSPAMLLSLLNQQLYESTPTAKYATLFLGIYDGAARRLTYSNGGHLPPILISEDGTSETLTGGGTVVGMFDNLSYPDATVQLRRGDIFVAYSDGVTEPENDYGEFGEERLIQIVKNNRHLSLDRITELVTAAVDDWIGDNEQPDDVTLVVARVK